MAARFVQIIEPDGTIIAKSIYVVPASEKLIQHWADRGAKIVPVDAEGNRLPEGRGE